MRWVVVSAKTSTCVGLMPAQVEACWVVGLLAGIWSPLVCQTSGVRTPLGSVWWRVSSIGLCGCRGHPPNSGWNNSTAATTQRARNPGVVGQPEKFLCDIPSKMIGSRGQIDKKISHSTGPLSPGPGAGSPPERFHKFFFFFFIGRRGEE